MRKINPTVKFFAVIAAAVLTAFNFSLFWNLALIGFCLAAMILAKANFKRLLWILLPITLVAVSLFMATYLNGRAAGEVGAGGESFFTMSIHGASLRDAAALSLRIYAYAFLGMLFSLTTGSNDLCYSLMQQLKIRPKFAYSVLAAFNLLPALQKEYGQILLAYKVRGDRVSPLSPKVAFSALVNTMHYSESLAMAMESKGFDENDRERTMYLAFRVRAADILWAIVVALIPLCGVLQ